MDILSSVRVKEYVVYKLFKERKALLFLLYLIPVLLNIMAPSLVLQFASKYCLYFCISIKYNSHTSILYFKLNAFDEQVFVICN